LTEAKKYSHFSLDAGNDEEEIAELSKEIEGLATQASVYIVDMKSKGIIRSEGEIRYTLDLSCEAKMEQLIRFMYQVENANSLIKVSKYNMAPKTKQSSLVHAIISLYKIKQGEPEVVEET